MSKLSIIVPAFNEAPTIKRLIEKLLAVKFPIPYEIVIVDDRSNDRTLPIIQELQTEYGSSSIKILSNEVNQGKGHSIQRGMEVASGDILVVQDADFEYEPSEIPGLLEPILRGEFKVVYGSRFLKTKRPAGMAFPNYIANVFLTFLTNVLYGSRLTDMETCYKVMLREVVNGIQLRANRFDFEPEVTTKLIKRGIAIKELPISYTGRNASEGKKIKGRDFFMAIGVLARNIFI